MTILETLEQIQDRLLPDSLPAGEGAIIAIENRMIEAIRAAGIADRITPADLDALTADNYHTIRRAAEALQRG